jgi:hypothetical protein
MLHSPGYGPPFRRRRRGMLTHGMMTVLGAAPAPSLLLAFYNPASAPLVFPAGYRGSARPGFAVRPAGGRRAGHRRRPRHHDHRYPVTMTACRPQVTS